jgi:hypothetical protein
MLYYYYYYYLNNNYRCNYNTSYTYTLYKSYKLIVITTREKDLLAKFSINILTYSNTNLVASLIYIIVVF